MIKTNSIFIILTFIYFMSIVWGQLPKAQDNAQTIEEFIDEKISEHNNSAVAHNDPGQSLDLHRKDTIIDHPAGSVKNDKFSFSFFDYQNYFSDFTSWGGNSLFDYNGDGSVFYTNPSSNFEIALWREFNNNFIDFGETISKLFSIDIMLDSYNWTSNDKVRIGVGDNSFTWNYFLGFEIRGNKLFAVAAKASNVQYSFEIENIDVLNMNRHSYLFIYDASQGLLQWFVDGQLVHSVDRVENDLITYVDPFVTIAIKGDGLQVNDCEFYFFNPRLSIDYTY